MRECSLHLSVFYPQRPIDRNSKSSMGNSARRGSSSVRRFPFLRREPEMGRKLPLCPSAPLPPHSPRTPDSLFIHYSLFIAVGLLMHCCVLRVSESCPLLNPTTPCHRRSHLSRRKIIHIHIRHPGPRHAVSLLRLHSSVRSRVKAGEAFWPVGLGCIRKQSICTNEDSARDQCSAIQ